MDQRSIKPGLAAVSLAGKRHPRTGEFIEPLGFRRDGRAIWPVMGGAPEDDDEDDDSRFTEDDEDESEEDDESDDDEDDTEKNKKKKSSKKSKSDDEDDDDEDEKPKYTEGEMYRVKRRMRKADQRASRLEAQLQELQRTLKAKPKNKDDEGDAGKDGADNEEVETLRGENTKLKTEMQAMKVQSAFMTVPLPKGEEWVDLEDAISAAQRLHLLDDILDEDGTVDKRSLRAALKELKRMKPHLVRKVSDPDESEDEEDDDGQGPKIRRTASKMNGKRKGDRGTKVDREALAAKFPALRSR